MTEKLIVFDTTLRDGEQSPGASMTQEEKVRIALQLEKLGVDIIEAGFAAASPGDFSAIEAVSRKVTKSTVCSLARAVRNDIDRAGNAIRHAKSGRIHTFIATSPIHMVNKLRMTPDQVLERAVEAVKWALEFTDDVEFSAEDAVRSEIPFLIEVFDAVIQAGAKTINVPDTVGYSIPFQWGDRIKQLIEKVPNSKNVIWSTHCHNDLGLAVANSLAAVLNGARQVECTVNGIGERAGNASLEELVMILRTRRDLLSLDTRIISEKIYPSSRLITSITGVPVQPNKAIVGANAFAHESGIHQDGLLKNNITYEIMTPQSVGLDKSNLVIGKHSGSHAFKDRVHSLGYNLNDEELKSVFASFKDLADNKKEIFDEDIEALIAEKVLRAPDLYRIINLEVKCGTHTTPTAAVEMEIDGRKVTGEETGDGPVDAAFKVIKNLTGTK